MHAEEIYKKALEDADLHLHQIKHMAKVMGCSGALDEEDLIAMADCLEAYAAKASDEIDSAWDQIRETQSTESIAA